MEHPDLDYSNPKRFGLKERASLVLASYSVAWALEAVCATCAHEVRNDQRLTEAVEQHGHALLAFWHEGLGLGAWFFRGTSAHTLTSYSYDGELAARIVRRFGLFALRGSSSKGGNEALRQLSRALDCIELIGITADGPRGPRRVTKPGLAILCARKNIPIIPIAFGASKAWRMNSWDRLVFPKPFSRIVAVYGPPIIPASIRSRGVIKELQRTIDHDLNTLQASLDEELGAPPFQPPEQAPE